MICRDRALSFRKGLLLMEYELDERGLAIPGTGQQFPLTASPRDIGRFSVGMGVYLTSIQLFVMLALFMAFAVGTPLMIMNGIGDNFTSTYVLQTNGENQVWHDIMRALVEFCGLIMMHQRSSQYLSFILLVLMHLSAL